MRHVSRTHWVALDWLIDRINLDPKIQIKYIDTKNQLADMLTKGNFTRDELNHLLCLFNISHFSSINSLEAMSKRTQEDASEGRVTAKSKPMMYLVPRYRVRDPNVLASTASEIPVKTKSEIQNIPLSSLNVQQTSTVRPVLGASSSNYSEWNIDDKWSSQVWKSGEMSNTSTWRPVYDKFVIDDDMDSDTATEIEPFSKITFILEQSWWSIAKDVGPFSRRCNAWHRQTFYDLANVYRHWKHLYSWERITQTICISKNTGKNLTSKQMFEISEKLILEQSEIFGVSQISWEIFPW